MSEEKTKFVRDPAEEADMGTPLEKLIPGGKKIKPEDVPEALDGLRGNYVPPEDSSKKGKA